MGAYAYCSRCENGLSRPSPYEVVEGKRQCPHCRSTIGLPHGAKDDLIVEMAEDIETLKREVTDLTEAVTLMHHHFINQSSTENP